MASGAPPSGDLLLTFLRLTGWVVTVEGRDASYEGVASTVVAGEPRSVRATGTSRGAVALALFERACAMRSRDAAETSEAGGEDRIAAAG